MAVPGKKATKQFSSSTTSKGSDEDFKVYCQPCDRDGPRLLAHGYCTNCSEHLCETCFTVHRRHTLSRHHTLLNKTNMPQTMSTVTPQQPDTFTKPCPKHNAKMIKFYCQDHKALFCSVCVTLNHTATSCKVNYIPDISGQTINSTEYHHILKDLNDMAERSSNILQDMKQLNGVSNKYLKEALTDIWIFRTTINQRLDEMVRQVKKAAKVIQEYNSKNLMNVETVCEEVSKSLKSSSDAIKHFNTSNQANDLFVELKHAEQMIKEHEHSVSKLSELEVKEYNFVPNVAILNLLAKEKSLGTLKGKILSPAVKSRGCSQMDKISIKIARNRYDCWITGMTLLTPDLLIITDYANRATKMVDISKKSLLAQKKFKSHPFDVTSVSQNEVAVTLPLYHSIKFFSVSRNNLKEKQTLYVHGQCHGISCHKDNIVVSYLNPGKVEILLTNGTVLQTLEDGNIFNNPEYITTSDTCIFVSDYTLKTVTKLNWQCEVTGKYDCTASPRGLAMSNAGTVFVCYYDNDTIEEISGDCSEGQVVVKDIKNPQAVYLSADTCTLYTSNWDNTREDNFIKLFKISK
ncbi:uncharacterized protein LOC132745776 [Ruditapes philippinarum]|uniref:uncharacterized protein LOC132745776 n=1 Tax=Ruditapes philippinarum TaxID=129788 RepID=UPI00295B12CF|nr:uncharacterized protein LOC132745776 [Ruditapes philippinarum]